MGMDTLENDNSYTQERWRSPTCAAVMGRLEIQETNSSSAACTCMPLDKATRAWDHHPSIQISELTL